MSSFHWFGATSGDQDDNNVNENISPDSLAVETTMTEEFESNGSDHEAEASMDEFPGASKVTSFTSSEGSKKQKNDLFRPPPSGAQNDAFVQHPASYHEKPKFLSRASLANNLQQQSMKKLIKKGKGAVLKTYIIALFGGKKSFVFHLVVIVLPCFISMWYSAAVLFPPEARKKYYILLWTDGHLVIKGGIPTVCPRSSICSDGILQIILISLARISAFASYVFMGVTFTSKMHFLMRFLSSTYLRTLVPFESFHHIHANNGKIFAGLGFLHTFNHYLRYILRKDVDQFGTMVHLSGLCAILAMGIVIISMSPIAKKIKNRFGSFDTRLACHWSFIILSIALLFHNGRTRAIISIFCGLWILDYLYGVIFATYSLEVVELLPLPGQSGLQMLWHNPKGFQARSGEYVKIQLPWLTHGGQQWHPFSIYLKESTQLGLNNVHRISLIDHDDEKAGNSTGDDGTSLKEFIALSLNTSIETDAIDAPVSLMVEEARQDLTNKFDTTQVFIHPVGSWTKGLLEDVQNQKQLRACWVRGPYKSPYFIAQEFSHLVLTASGIGITPALGVMGQYPGFSRTKILVWSTRDKNMLKFFAPLIRDAHLAVIFYTGKEKLSHREEIGICSHGNIYVQQSRPKSLPETIGSIIVQFENNLNDCFARSIEDIDRINKASWCILYCGGSFRIRDDLQAYSKKNHVSFHCELFDW